MIIAPLTSIWGLDTERSYEPVLMTVLSFFLIFFLIEFNLVKAIRFPYFKNSRGVINCLAWISVGYLIAWSIISGAVFNINFNPNLVYDFRDENSSMIDIGFLNYLNIWTYKFFTIFLFLIALSRRRYFLAGSILLIQVYFYGITAHKLVFFLPFFAFGVWYYFSRTKSLIVLPIAYNVIVLIAFFLYLVFQIDLIAAMMIRRVFYVPAALSFEWFSFFESNPKTYWSDSILSSFLEYPYSAKLPFVVGNHLLGPELGANNGYVSSGFAQAGYMGVVIYSALLALIVKQLDSISKDGVPMWLTVALTIGPLRTAISDSDLLTAILSHGIFVAFIILILYREKVPSFK
ncbi:MAG: hypothetical protein KKH44_04895 [Bacteroidetes bacterium]|nr:hypothetical protein [Bacteroidota bacterium]